MATALSKSTTVVMRVPASMVEDIRRFIQDGDREPTCPFYDAGSFTQGPRIAALLVIGVVLRVLHTERRAFTADDPLSTTLSRHQPIALCPARHRNLVEREVSAGDVAHLCGDDRYLYGLYLPIRRPTTEQLLQVWRQGWQVDSQRAQRGHNRKSKNDVRALPREGEMPAL
jgi:hypothetical protein